MQTLSLPNWPYNSQRMMTKFHKLTTWRVSIIALDYALPVSVTTTPLVVAHGYSLPVTPASDWTHWTTVYNSTDYSSTVTLSELCFCQYACL